MDPGLDKVGLAVLPPVVDWPAPYDRSGNLRTTRAGRRLRRLLAVVGSSQSSGTPAERRRAAHYGVAEPQFDYLTEACRLGNWTPPGNTLQLVQTLNCVASRRARPPTGTP